MGQNLLSKIVEDIIERHGLTLELFEVDDAAGTLMAYNGVKWYCHDQVWAAIQDKIAHLRPSVMGVLLWQANDPVRDNVGQSTEYSLTTGRAELQTLVARILERRVFWHLYDRMVAEHEGAVKLAKQMADAEAWLDSPEGQAALAATGH